jgi:MFS transporter, FHS family, L-fucose permease
MYSGYRLTLLLLCTTFTAVGLIVSSIGPALPELARQTGRSLATLGTLFIALFGGGLLAQVLSGVISDRFGRRIILVTSSAMFGSGALALSLSTRLAAVLVFAGLLGLGYGGVSLSVNVLSSELTPHRRASTVNLVNVFFGVGGILGPLLAGLALDWWGTPLPALQSGALLLILVAPVAAFVALPSAHEAPSASARGASTATLALSSAFVWSSAILLLVYAGSEASVGSWTPVYLRRTTLLDPAEAAAITASFWASLCVGRVLAVVVGLRVSAERLLTVSFVASVAAAALLLAGHGTVWLTVSALALLGLAFGPVYPTIMAIVTAAYPRAAGAAAGRLGALASIGGMILPSLHGLLLTRVGTWSSVAVTLATTCVMLFGWMAIRHRAH